MDGLRIIKTMLAGNRRLWFTVKRDALESIIKSVEKLSGLNDELIDAVGILENQTKCEQTECAKAKTELAETKAELARVREALRESFATPSPHERDRLLAAVVKKYGCLDDPTPPESEE